MDFSSILSLILALAAIVLVLYLCYAFSKFMANRVNNVSKYNNIRVVERVALAQDKGLVIIEIGGKYYLVGFSNNSIQILQELEESELHFSQPSLKQSFMDVLNSTVKSRMDMKTGDKDDKISHGDGEVHSTEPRDRGDDGTDWEDGGNKDE